MGYLMDKIRNQQQVSKWLFLPVVVLMKVVYTCCYFHRYEGDPGMPKTMHGSIMISWHNRLLFWPLSFSRSVRRNTSAVISASRDGGYLAHILNWFAIGELRGSSRRDGAKAMRGAIQAAKEGKNVCFTPDGPRGPRYHLSMGPVMLASLTGMPIRPLNVNSSRYWAYKSWDKFQIPKPFATLTLVVGDEIRIPPNLSDEELEQYRIEVEKALMKVTRD